MFTSKGPVDTASPNRIPLQRLGTRQIQPRLTKARAIGEIVASHRVSIESVGLQFPLRHPAIKAVVTGVRTAHELDTNVAAFDVDVPEALWNDLESSGLVEPLRL